MTPEITEPQITVLNAGGQYCHLIARKVRELGVYAEVAPSDIAAERLRGRRGVIISGGPSSVYEPESPTIDPNVLSLGAAVLGICYGQQLMAYQLGGEVQKGDKGEYGFAMLEVLEQNSLLAGIAGHQQVWMSHRDLVAAPPPGFTVLARTSDCAVAAMGDPERKLFGVQFHPEVVHTHKGAEILRNFLFAICGCRPDWDPSHRLEQLEQSIRERAAGRSVFFFVSGGVDSSVAFTLCLRALGPGRVTGLYVDTGLMREGETAFVREVFAREAPGSLEIEHAEEQFLGRLEGVTDPEEKRRRIGEEFVNVQQRLLESHHFLEGNWILGQGTIYPDTIESGGAKNASVIKTHHNRVPGIQKLIDENRIIEPLDNFYKDEVREIGRELGLPAELLERHPFPGPGLAIRCLCSEEESPIERLGAGWLVPVRSVGVQGDSRSYRPVLAIEAREDNEPLHAVATELINRHAGINRVIGLMASHAPLEQMQVRRASLDRARLDRLRRADALVRQLSHESGFDRQIWQFPVILIPVGIDGRPDSVVLRPVDSVDGMTAQSVPIPAALLAAMSEGLLAIEGVAGVWLDLTHKPPGTIEWE